MTVSRFERSKFRRVAALVAMVTACLLLRSGFVRETTVAPKYVLYLQGQNFVQSHFSTWSADMTNIYMYLSQKRDMNPPDFQSLLSNPLGANATSSKLTKSADIIQEAQRLHFTLFPDLFHPAKHAVLISMTALDDKKDPAISVGELLLIRRLGLNLLYYCTKGFDCDKENFSTAAECLTEYANDEVIILMQGGNNLVTHPFEDTVRSEALKAFSRFRFVFFPQGITLLPSSEKHLKSAEEIYRNRPNLTMVLRDPQSYNIAVRHFGNTTRLVMAPDMAFQIGLIPRTMFPIYDIIWIRRGDQETSEYALPELPENVTITVDHRRPTWMKPAGANNMENAVLVANSWFTFLQRARVVITDRLHEHIIATLLDIPHVLIDNPYHKLSSYHNTWTQSSENTVLTDNPDDALRMALYLLEKFKDKLPPILPFMNFVRRKFY